MTIKTLNKNNGREREFKKVKKTKTVLCKPDGREYTMFYIYYLDGTSQELFNYELN